MQRKISDILPKTEILAQLAEEASKLAQAALKLRRALDGTNPTPKSVEECRNAMVWQFKNEDMTPDEFADYITAKSEQVKKELRERWS